MNPAVCEPRAEVRSAVDSAIERHGNRQSALIEVLLPTLPSFSLAPITATDLGANRASNEFFVEINGEILFDWRRELS